MSDQQCFEFARDEKPAGNVEKRATEKEINRKLRYMQSLPNDDPTKTCSHTNFLIGFFLAKHRLENSRTGKKGHGQVPAAKFDLGSTRCHSRCLGGTGGIRRTARLIHFTTCGWRTGATF